jgi:hypothetical protein
MARAERSRQQIGRDDGILNRVVDADATHRRHGVRGVADQQQSLPEVRLNSCQQSFAYVCDKPQRVAYIVRNVGCSDITTRRGG